MNSFMTQLEWCWGLKKAHIYSDSKALLELLKIYVISFTHKAQGRLGKKKKKA